VYNVPELKDKQPLNLTPEVLVDILLGKINYWDDPKIKELNPEVANLLPHKEIYFIHRSDGSGTTAVFTSYLSFVSSEWKTKVGSGKTVQWPLDSMGRGTRCTRKYRSCKHGSANTVLHGIRRTGIYEAHTN
jgi:phosphate transport system substrate-binding protein